MTDFTSFSGLYRGAPVLVTGHTGFKGAWLAAWLHQLGAEVHGLALDPSTTPSLFDQAELGALLDDRRGDIRRPETLGAAIAEIRPRVILHLAARAIVRESYEEPLETLQTNVMGTAHLLDALRAVDHPCAVVVVTSDKCYENRESECAYREDDPLGGHDPYSASKGAAELVTASFRRSFFPPAELERHQVALASARAGNVIGPGDWAPDRIVPDSVCALSEGRAIAVRNPESVRPWQHVLESLSGYLTLAAHLLGDDPAPYCEAWNFGPLSHDARPVRALVDAFIDAWGNGSWRDVSRGNSPHEAGLLRLSIEKAERRMGWRPVWAFEETVRRTAVGYRSLHGASAERARGLLREEVDAYTDRARQLGLAWTGEEQQ